MAECRSQEPRLGEFVALAALMSSLVALSIDVMLPALPAIGAELGVAHANDPQLVLTALFAGMAVGHTVYGPLSDSIGRKPAIQAGIALFLIGCLLSVSADSFMAMLAGRVLQGFGAAGPRIVTVALVRDRFEGRAMARVISLIMTVFIFVPTVAPGLGQGILMLAGWRAIFVMLLGFGLLILAWFGLRQPETLAPERRASLSLRRIALAVGETCANRAALGYTVTGGLVFGAFVGYLISAQQVFQDHYGVGTLFPLYFAVLALAIGGATLTNARLVMRFGMRRLCAWALRANCLLSLAFFAVTWAAAGDPPLWALMAFLAAAFFCIGIVFGNLSGLAMEKLGHIAGVAASVVGFVQTMMSMALGSAIGRAYDGTVIPLIGGFAGLGIAAIAVNGWAERDRGAAA
jgi:DHA1 family bicyclomycin/chloramphenicol resistance-like MFS transporter